VGKGQADRCDPITASASCAMGQIERGIRGLKLACCLLTRRRLPEPSSTSRLCQRQRRAGFARRYDRAGVRAVFDKGYCTTVVDAIRGGGRFVTRPKTTMRIECRRAPHRVAHGAWFTVSRDHEVRFAAGRFRQLPMRFAPARVQRTDGKTITLLTMK